MSAESKATKRGRASVLLGALLGALLLPAGLFSQSPCTRCHPKQVEGYALSGMSRSFGRPENHPGGQVAHEASAARFTILTDENGMRHRMSRNGRTEEHAISYFIGSGHTGRSYLASRQGYLFQSPVSYYTERAAWGMSPGYAEDTHADFSRPVTAECLQCHAGRALPVEGTRNRYQGPPFAAEAISCERCHGPSEAHLAHPSRETIVNPKELPPRARASVCEQCHLAGEARVPNPGHTLADFQPGMKLEDVWSAYVLSRPPGAATDAMKAVSHAESLARSGCAQASGEAMWCGSCHNPHETPANAAAYYRGRCLACHGEELPTTHAEPNRDCIGCHMPKQGAADIAHAAVTDHRIPRDPRSRPAAGDSQSASGASQSAANAGQQLSVWSEPPAAFRRRNFGLALIEVGERYRYDRLMQEGLRVLSGARESFPRDPAVLAAMAKALYGQRKFSEAAALFETAAEIEPRVAEYALHLGSSYRALGETEKATEYFERAIRLDPGREDAYQALAGLYEATKRPEEARRTLSRHELFLDGR